jgi:hypothetical protein
MLRQWPLTASGKYDMSAYYVASGQEMGSLKERIQREIPRDIGSVAGSGTGRTAGYSREDTR